METFTLIPQPMNYSDPKPTVRGLQVFRWLDHKGYKEFRVLLVQPAPKVWPAQQGLLVRQAQQVPKVRRELLEQPASKVRQAQQELQEPRVRKVLKVRRVYLLAVPLQATLRIGTDRNGS